MPIKIQKGDEVKINYTLKPVDGKEVIDGKKSAEFRVGKGEVIAGIEKAILKMKKGEKKMLTITPENGFGEHNKVLIKEIPKDHIKEKEVREDQIGENIIFTKKHTNVKILEVSEHKMLLDLNHSLAGKLSLLN